MGENEKASRYIAQLDDARCHSRWNELPELARKVEKHAPHRSCLALTARAEAQVAVYNEKRSTADSESASASLSKLIPSLLTAVDQESAYAQDAFQAVICLGWLHWVLDEPHLAIARFPKDFGAVLYKLSNSTQDLSGWTKVCIVKGAYLKGFSQEKGNRVEDGIVTYMSVLPYLSSLESLSSASPQLKYWTEWLLSRLCLLSDQSQRSGAYLDPDQALRVFRIWGKLFEVKPGLTRSTASAGTSTTITSRGRVWKAYYDTLSAILQHDVAYSLSSNTIGPYSTENEKENGNIRLQQRAELKRVETLYEAQLLEETQFPKASQSNADIEIWVDSVIDNWRVLCGPRWQDEDLGEGGKAAVGHEVLDILYRAATKTFHSTQILRHLFAVHASLAEFDLAFKAFDSYVEIVTRGKAREEQSGEEDLGLDDDDTMLRTAAEAIRVLCRFGDLKEAEKALEIGNLLTQLLQKHDQHIYSQSTPRSTSGDTYRSSSVDKLVSPVTRAIAYRAIGVSQAHWARVTYDAASRSKIQADAVRNLSKALDPQLNDPSNVETLYSLALVMAEMRDISGAIKVAKRALSAPGQSNSSASPDGVASMSSPNAVTSDFVHERKLIPVWHLLSLLLTARSEFFTAGKACEAAFEQFHDPTILFGRPSDSPMYKSSHLNDISGLSKVGLVDQMETFEKESIVQIKLTQLALIEEIEGASAAVDASDELLALYGRLFGDDKAIEQQQQPPATANPPKSRAGTIRGNIFRRPKTSHTAVDVPPPTAGTVAAQPIAGDRVPTASPAAAPAIQITNSDASNDVRVPRQANRRETSVPRRSESTRLRKKSVGSLRRPSQDVITNIESHEKEDAVPPLEGSQRARSSSVASRHSRHRTTGSITQSIDGRDHPPLPGKPRQGLTQDVRLPGPFPPRGAPPLEPRFPMLEERRHKLSLLTDIWLFICGLYTRAGLHEDAKEAIQEANNIVVKLEGEVSKETYSSRALSEKGWGAGKSIEELWADIWCARGDLSLAQDLPHAALDLYEKALSHFPDHPAAIVNLSSILLDIFTKTIAPEPPRATGALAPTIQSEQAPDPLASDNPDKPFLRRSKSGATPSELHRLAARDRAHGLLSALTKLGSGWDYSEAWYVLARAYEEGGQADKAKEVLWWCVELEDSKPLRSWCALGNGGVVL